MPDYIAGHADGDCRPDRQTRAAGNRAGGGRGYRCWSRADRRGVEAGRAARTVAEAAEVVGANEIYAQDGLRAAETDEPDSSRRRAITLRDGQGIFVSGLSPTGVAATAEIGKTR